MARKWYRLRSQGLSIINAGGLVCGLILYRQRHQQPVYPLHTTCRYNIYVTIVHSRRSVLAVWMPYFIHSWKMGRCDTILTCVHVATLLSMEGGTLLETWSQVPPLSLIHPMRKSLPVLPKLGVCCCCVSVFQGEGSITLRGQYY